MHYTNYFFNFEFCIGDCISHLNDGHVDAAKFTSVGHVDTAKFTVTETAMLIQQSLPCDTYGELPVRDQYFLIANSISENLELFLFTIISLIVYLFFLPP